MRHNSTEPLMKARWVRLATIAFLTVSAACGGGGGRGGSDPDAFTVDSHSDDVDASLGDGVCATSTGSCTLRAAIQEANQDPGFNVVYLSHGSYALFGGGLVVSDDLGVVGNEAGDSVIEGSALLDSVFSVVSGNVTINRVTIRNGGLGNRSGIDNASTLTLLASRVTGNTSGNGGGIANTGTLALIDSTVDGNAAENVGAGIANEHGGMLIMMSSTVSGNVAGNTGGGIHNDGRAQLTNTTVSGNGAGNVGGGIENHGSLILNNCTIAANTADNVGSGIDNDGEVVVTNTLIAGNQGQGSDCSGFLDSGGFNLVQDMSGCTIAGVLTGNLTDVEPRLGPLADNGGPTLTHALLSGSPAIDAASPAISGNGETGCEPADQRGVSRPQGGGCDIGAYEVDAE